MVYEQSDTAYEGADDKTHDTIDILVACHVHLPVAILVEQGIRANARTAHYAASQQDGGYANIDFLHKVIVLKIKRLYEKLFGKDT
jgi:hypothetical protein